MKFDIPKKEHPNLEKYNREDIDAAYRFANELYKELGSMLRAVVIFGSTARHTQQRSSDLDILVILDDILMSMTPEVLEAYRIIVQRIIVRVSTKIHVTTLRFTAFWDYVRNGDPVSVNILRDGVAVIDSGFFDPLQALLKRGRIRPTKESIWTYYARAPNTLHNSKWHIMQGTMDLYWAVIDAAHAALMKVGEIPPTPEHISYMMDKALVKKKLLEPHYAKTMQMFYKLMKMITRAQIREISGKQFDHYFKLADDFVRRMKKVIEHDLR